MEDVLEAAEASLASTSESPTSPETSPSNPDYQQIVDFLLTNVPEFVFQIARGIPSAPQRVQARFPGILGKTSTKNLSWVEIRIPGFQIRYYPNFNPQGGRIKGDRQAGDLEIIPGHEKQGQGVPQPAIPLNPHWAGVAAVDSSSLTWINRTRNQPPHLEEGEVLLNPWQPDGKGVVINNPQTKPPSSKQTTLLKKVSSQLSGVETQIKEYLQQHQQMGGHFRQVTPATQVDIFRISWKKEEKPRKKPRGKKAPRRGDALASLSWKEQLRPAESPVGN